MNNKYIKENEIIERYLLGKLSDDERQKFRVALLFDKNLQQEVEDTRLLQQQIQLLKTTKSLAKKQSFTPWIIGGLLLLFIVIVSYFINKNIISQEEKIPTTIEKPQKTIESTIESIIKSTIEESTKPATDDLLKQEEQQPIVEPFIPNQKVKKPPQSSQPIAEAEIEKSSYLEQFIDGNFRNNEVRIQVRSPKVGETLLLKNGAINLDIKAILSLDKMPEKERFVIRLFSNKKVDFDNFKPILSANPTISKSGNNYELSFNAIVPLPKGLYYYIIEDNDVEDMIYAGKVLVK
jgi:hypothetical protein